MLKKVFTCVWLLWALVFHLDAQTPKELWIDSIFSTMTQDEKIGQLFMISVHARNENYRSEIKEALENHHVGGLIFADGGPTEIASFNNEIHSFSRIPLLTAIDAEWGLGKHLDSTITFPKTIALGALRDDSLLYEMGAEIGRQMKLLGIQMNLAPNASVRRVVGNYVAGLSFGDDTLNVTSKALAYFEGLRSQGILACAKYFPVEGITVLGVQDDDLPILSPYADSAKVRPFKKLFKAGVHAVLPASSEFPLFYEKKKMIRKNKFSASILSAVYAGNWLKNNMDFDGLVFARMPDVFPEGRYGRGDAELLAFQAGNEMILYSQDVAPAIRKIRRLLRRENQYETQLNNAVRKILATKYDAGLHTRKPIDTDNLHRKLNAPQGLVLKENLYRNSITVVNNNDNTLPLQLLETRTMAVLTLGNSGGDSFSKYVSKYCNATVFTITNAADTTGLFSQLKKFNTILVGLYPASAKWQRSVLAVLEPWQSDTDIVVCQFDSPIQLSETERFSTVVEAYGDENDAQRIVPQILFGATGADGTLPVNISSFIRQGQGVKTTDLKRLGYSIPEDAGMDTRVLEKIDRIAQEAIETKSTPGCHVLVARGGKVVYEKSYGWFTYEKESLVTDETIYDLASVTKVLATLQTVMFMYDRHLIDINKKASWYLPELKNSNKKDITLKDILTHQAGLWPFLPFWAQTVRDSVFMPEFYNTVFSDQYPFVVAEDLYASNVMRDSLWQWIIQAKIREKPVRTPFDYRYSDMGFYILQHLAEKVLNQPMEDFLQQNLYEPLGAHSTGYLPLTRFPKSMIAPTENDRLFRKRLLVGTVHDQGAAMHGGVAGHAGLFSNANDMAKVGQMLLQDGEYGGIRYYSPQTVRLFTHKQYELSRRGLGWDRPVQSDWNSPASIYASPKTFGHTGFTGTCIWIDPEFDLIYIFLSNRVHPDMTNNKLIHANIRSRIQDVIYQSIFSYCANN